jgi:hypothetical protein
VFSPSATAIHDRVSGRTGPGQRRICPALAPCDRPRHGPNSPGRTRRPPRAPPRRAAAGHHPCPRQHLRSQPPRRFALPHPRSERPTAGRRRNDTRPWDHPPRPTRRPTVRPGGNPFAHQQACKEHDRNCSSVHFGDITATRPAFSAGFQPAYVDEPGIGNAGSGGRQIPLCQPAPPIVFTPAPTRQGITAHALTASPMAAGRRWW